MKLPIIIDKPDGAHEIVRQPFHPLCYPAGDDLITLPPNAAVVWERRDWEADCPNWTVRELVEAPLADPGAGMRAVERPRAEWIDSPDAVTVTYASVALTPAELAAQLAGDRNAKVRAIDAERDRRLELGALHAGKRFATSDSSRTDLGGMATTAGLVMLGALPDWPDDYAKGWIAIDNTRLPLPTPAEGVALAAAVALAYSATVQHARDLKDAALTAADPAAVDELAGWPD